jgi:hypothetical protein
MNIDGEVAIMNRTAKSSEGLLRGIAFSLPVSLLIWSIAIGAAVR